MRTGEERRRKGRARACAKKGAVARTLPGVASASVCLAAALMIAGVPASAHASDAGTATEVLSPAEAVELAVSGDAGSQTFVVRGEAIGEALRAPAGRRWVNVLGDGVALGVVVDAQVAEAIPRFGAYRRRGATLLVTGTLQQACSEHGGDLDMHAGSVVILDDGEEIPHAVHPAKLGLAAAGFALAAALALRYRRLRTRSRLS